ncbi:cupin fold metalloprotein, WbuC family [Bacteroides clarus]|uniref:Cupin fold metalloprotein, WbuC family n=1 Tax=Bacteroides clarus TaxID=626929 RepID=A0A412N1X6_9BACE|nr:WbuC family cupin fold metalloprotein [Bacteroides clarus]RGT31507.1 cupin fold metalloprotein, WbuC family [Bacteroides clarus]
MELITQSLIDDVVKKAKASPRLRMNYNLHSDLSDKCQRFINAMEPGTIIPIHHHHVAEVYILLQGRLKIMIYDDKAVETQAYILDRKDGDYGIQIPLNTWHSVEVLEEGTVIMEIKEGPYVPHEQSGILER